MALTHALSTNNYGNPRLIVATSAANGTHTTLASAMADAVSGDTIALRDSVTENVTITPGVNITSLSGGGSLNVPSITGTLTMTGAGTSTLSGLRLVTNSAALIAITGSAASNLYVDNCYVNCSNNTGITFSSSSSSAALTLNNCEGNIGTTGITLFSHSSAGALAINYCRITNTGNATTASTVSAGIFNSSYSDLLFPITTSSTAAIGCGYSNFNTAATNTIALTLGGSGIQSIKYCGVQAGSASAITISATAVVQFTDINSTNTNAITGAGAIVYSGLTFSGTSFTINTTTQTGSGTLIGSRNTAPSAGFLGERVTSTFTSATPASGTPTTGTSISLTAGVWDVTAMSRSFSTTNVLAACIVGISTVTNTFQGTDGNQKTSFNTTVVGVNTVSVSVPAFRVTLSATTTYYLVMQANYASGAISVNGRLSAVRVG